MPCTDWTERAKAGQSVLVAATDAAAQVMHDTAASLRLCAVSLRTLCVPRAADEARLLEHHADELDGNAASLDSIVAAARANPLGPLP